MNDEIKLKDMTDFLENVYKNIKEQPTLEEELEKERKFINKIKGDNKDEIKEILDYLANKDNDLKGINFLRYQDLTRGQINLLLDYITNLQQENERLQEDYNKAMDLVDKGVENSYKLLKDYKSRCEKAIEYIKSVDEDILNSMFLDESYISNYGAVELLNILQNGDNSQ